MVDFSTKKPGIQNLDVKWLIVENDVDQYLLERYAAMEFDLPLDEFGTH